MTSHATDLVGIGDIPPDYVHHAKIIAPGPRLSLPRTHFKWYEVSLPHAEVPDRLRQDAREFLRAETDSGRLAVDDELGFVVLHRCGESFYFLLVCTWRHQNEMWETVYGRDVSTADTFTVVPQGTHLEVMCVWESPAVLHEHLAWARYLRTTRGNDDKHAYLGDMFAGTV